MKRTKRGRTVPAYEQIMTAARELFAKNGFRDTTIRMIAQKAKVNGAAINYYFSSKEALYEEIFDQAFQKFGRPLGDLIGTVKDQATWKAALEKWFDFMLELFLLDTPERALFRRLVAQERSSPTEFCTRLYDDVFLPVVGVFRTLMRMALPDATPEAFQAVFVTYLGGNNRKAAHFYADRHMPRPAMHHKGAVAYHKPTPHHDKTWRSNGRPMNHHPRR